MAIRLPGRLVAGRGDRPRDRAGSARRVTRTIIPIINQPSPAAGVRSALGLGDINPQFYLSPAKPGGLIWGIGPTFTFPTATSPILGADKWSAGPALVVLTIQGHWVVGSGGQPAMVLCLEEGRRT